MIKRREFLKAASITSAAVMLPKFDLLASPSIDRNNKIDSIIRIGGEVTANGKPIANVVVSDGNSLVATDKNGSYELLATGRFVYLSLPSGYQIPQNETGTAKFYKEIDRNNQTASYDFKLEKTDDDSNHSFIVFADTQTQNEHDMERFHKETIPDVSEVVKQQNLKNVFGVSVGDIMYNNLELYPGYEKGIKRTGIPFFQALGNHDCIQDSQTDEQSLITFENHFGPAYYSFNRGNVHYVVLDDIFWFGGYMGYVNQKQLDWLTKDLSFVKPGSPVVIFAHIPPYTTQAIRYKKDSEPNGIRIVNKELLYDLLQMYKARFICGHTHESQYISDSGIEIHVAGAVCGAWWTADICFDGTPNGYTIYTINGDDFSWQYKPTGKSLEHQMRIFAPKSDHNASDELIANVWGYDEKWKVEWYEDDKAMGQMEKRIGLDPVTVELFEGKDKPVKHTWIEPMINDHMFYSEPSKAAKKLTVKVTDRWGRVFSEIIALKN